MRAVDAAEVQNSTFSTSLHSSSSAQFGITGYYDLDRFHHAGSQDTDLSFHVYQFPPFIALCDYNPPTVQTDGQTDVMLVAKNTPQICSKLCTGYDREPCNNG